ncbi:hypothetical protein SUGI_0433030 [Cryptomeria japonica]|nr:hypothetical protein SUGI_0433030 [Cryptomeria japonica]
MECTSGDIINEHSRGINGVASELSSPRIGDNLRSLGVEAKSSYKDVLKSNLVDEVTLVCAALNVREDGVWIQILMSLALTLSPNGSTEENANISSSDPLFDGEIVVIKALGSTNPNNSLVAFGKNVGLSFCGPGKAQQLALETLRAWAQDICLKAGSPMLDQMLLNTGSATLFDLNKDAQQMGIISL